MMCNTCDDNRFQLIEKYKAEIVAATNIAGCKEEMDVLDNILFRFWQIGWLDKLEKPVPQWIPCSERLPKRKDETQMRGYYLTTNAYGSVGLTKYEFEGGGLGYAWDSDIRIVAWMPLPEPYKEVLD